MISIEDINRMIGENELEKALVHLEERLAYDPQDDGAYYLKGSLFWKQGNWKLAIENYLKATEINPESPARQAYEMVMEIINFSNPDLYNP
ncbi:tetratricopeptide repeat protein [Barnesiella viscericola]|uniref:tetratricopeptide repeat protein n=1 Tax=Barnesiella viscericola TaxID=397865 RepID=UPI0025A390B2|nr:tetratricopeptide repeat protein [Barnesiella viscericola]MDM8269471.1 tetratricopeptide repeat protein [Barnesiella viscericola]